MMPNSLVERRSRLMGPNVPTFYSDPLHIVRGEDVWLWDADGRRYLDAYNNVPHVGHCHPAVVEAIARQSRMLNTHTRYLHEAVLDYLERITATLNDDISQGMLVCTASEANDIALRMARVATGKTGIIATDATYHGNTTATSILSTRRPPIGGYPPNVRLVPPPRGSLETGPDEEQRAEEFAAHVEKAIAELERSGEGFSCLIICPFFANEGFPDISKGFLDRTVEIVRRAGGLIIADEVQPGFGRLGDAFWGHDHLGFAPDIVTLGKSIANGYPAAALLTRPDLMTAFRQAFGYFNTYGGNPVAAAAALATLDVIANERLQENAARVGRHALSTLRRIAHPLIADVRGSGLFFGLEMRGDGARTGTQIAETLVEAMCREGVLVNRIGPAMNILKIRPPMTFSEDHVALLSQAVMSSLGKL